MSGWRSTFQGRNAGNSRCPLWLNLSSKCYARMWVPLLPCVGRAEQATMADPTIGSGDGTWKTIICAENYTNPRRPSSLCRRYKGYPFHFYCVCRFRFCFSAKRRKVRRIFSRIALSFANFQPLPLSSIFKNRTFRSSCNTLWISLPTLCFM